MLYAILCDLLSVRTVVLSQKTIHLLTYLLTYIFYNNHYTKYVDQVEVGLLDVYN